MGRHQNGKFVLPKCIANFRSDLVYPHRGSIHKATIIYLHGYKVGGRRVRLSAPEDLPEGVRCVLPTAHEIPITACGGRPQLAWYDYQTNHRGKAEGDLDAETLAASRERILALAKQEVRRLGGDWRRLFIGGTSQGCAMALDVFLRSSK